MAPRAHDPGNLPETEGGSARAHPLESGFAAREAELARIRRLYDRHARFYDITRRFLLPERRLAIRRLGLCPGERVIDFACGTGLNFSMLRESRPSSLTGVDVSARMLARARRRDPGARLVLGDLCRVRLGARAERALCTYALSMIGPWEEALRNMHRHLVPGGTLVLLDFHRLTGLLGAANPLLAWWLARYGVRLRGEPVAILRDLFEDVEVRVRAGGYAAITRARGAHPTRAGPLPRPPSPGTAR